MAKIDYAAIKAGLEDIQAYSAASADKLMIFPRQGLGGHYLSQVAMKANFLLSLFNGETNDEKSKRNQFFSNQFPIFDERGERIPLESEIPSDAEHPGRLE